jgi:hypothetical protein
MNRLPTELQGIVFSYLDYAESDELLCLLEPKTRAYVERIWLRETKTETVVKNGFLVHLVNGKKHKRDGPAVIGDRGIEGWFINNMLHRDDGPAQTGKISRSWYKRGKLHRIGGPAIVGKSGSKFYYIDGVEQTQTECVLL